MEKEICFRGKTSCSWSPCGLTRDRDFVQFPHMQRAQRRLWGNQGPAREPRPVSQEEERWTANTSNCWHVKWFLLGWLIYNRRISNSAFLSLGLMHQFFLLLVFPTFYSTAVALLKTHCEKQGWDVIVSIYYCKMVLLLYACLSNHGNSLSSWASAARVSPYHSGVKGCLCPCSQLEKAPSDPSLSSHAFWDATPILWTFWLTWWDGWASHTRQTVGGVKRGWLWNVTSEKAPPSYKMPKKSGSSALAFGRNMPACFS